MEPNPNLNPAINNALAGAGIWGTISSNIEWRPNGNITLSEICRYPRNDLITNAIGGGGIHSPVSPSEESPIEIIIDISNRPICNYPGLWIQFDYRYVAQNATVSFDTNNDGIYNITREIINNTESTLMTLEH